MTVRETGKEMSNELAKIEYEEILGFNHKIRKKFKASKRMAEPFDRVLNY